MRKQITATIIALLVTASAHAGWDKMRADLFGGDGIVDGKSTYRERDRNDGLERRFAIKVEDAVPGTTFDVWLGDYFVGDMTANSLGIARIKLRTPQHIDDPGDGDPMPANFPVPQRTDIVVAGALSGLFFDRNSDASNDSQRYRLRSDFTGATVMDGDVRYIERFKRGRLLRKFKVEIEDADAGDVFDILVNGTPVGSIVIGNDDQAEFQLRTPEFIDDAGDGDPMPDDFPTLLPGDVVTVGPLTAVLEED